MARWTIKDIKDKGIFIDNKGVGRVLYPAKKEVTDKDIEKSIKKARRKIRGSTESGENL